MKERKLTFVENCFKDPIKARNIGYALGMFAFLTIALASWALVDMGTALMEVQELAKDNLELEEQNEILRKNWNSLAEKNGEKNKIILELVKGLPCDKMKIILMDSKYDIYQFEIEKMVMGLC